MLMNPSNTIIVCASKHHGNTRRVADAMASVLNAPVVEPSEVSGDQFADHDLIGFGSGIYFGRPDAALMALIKSLPKKTRRTFVFSTAGTPLLRWFYHRSLKRELAARGCEVIAEFICPGWDTVGPLAWIGGIFRHRPNEQDLENARRFARSIAR